MTKIFFPFKDANRFSFAYRDMIAMSFQKSPTIRFPFVIEGGFSFDISVDADGITLYLINAKTQVIKDVSIEGDAIVMHLNSESTYVDKRIYVKFKQLGLGLHLLGMIDALTLGELDPYTLGDISYCFADWKRLQYSVISLGKDTIIFPEDTPTYLINGLINPEKNVEIGNLHSSFGLSDISTMRHMTLGELDPRLIADIDTMASVFQTFGKVPAVLVQEVTVSE